MGKDRKRSKSSSSSSSSRDRKKSHKKHKKPQKHSDKPSKVPQKPESQPQSRADNEDWRSQKLDQTAKEDLTADEKIQQVLDRIKQSNPVEPENPFKNKPPLDPKKKKEPPKFEPMNSAAPKMIEVVVNDRLGKKVRVKCWYFFLLSLINFL